MPPLLLCAPPLHHHLAASPQPPGNLFGPEFRIQAGHQRLARVSRAWFRLRDTYGVDVAPGQDGTLSAAIAACPGRIHHDEQQEHHCG